MALIVEAVGQSGVVERITVEGGAAVINAQPGLTYRILDASGRPVNASATVRRVGDHLIIEGLPEETTIQLADFFFVCTPSDPCSLDLEGLGGARGETINQISEPIAALADGSFVLHAPASMATPVAPEAEFSAKPALAGLALLGLVGGGGGGGGGGDGPPPPPPGSTTVTSPPYTNDSTPVIRGTAVPGAQITVTLDIPGSGPVTFNTIADGNGNWSIDTGTAAPTAGAMPADGIPVDQPTTVRILTAGSSQPITYQLAMDLVPPAPPMIEAVTGDDIINADEAREANPSPITVSGTAEPGSTVLVSWHGDEQPATADADGRWSVTFDGQLIPDGPYVITAVATDVAGNASAPGQRSVTVETGRPSAPNFNDVAADNIINAAETNDGITITGTTSAGTQVFVSIPGLFTDRPATVSGTTWSLELSPAELQQLPDGQAFQVTAYANDGVNQSVASTSDPVQVDRTPPTQTATIAQAIDDEAPITGPISSGGATNDATPQLQGTLSAALGAGETLQIMRDGSVVGAAVVTNTGSGWTWVFNDALQGDGTYSYAARVVDAAGNAGPSSMAFVLALDTSPPTQTASITQAIDNVAPGTNPVPSGGHTNDSTPQLQGTLSAPLGAGESLQILRDGAVIGSADVSGTSWSFGDSLAQDGSYSYTARVVDAVGHVGPSSSPFSLVLDTTAPTQAPTITQAVDNVGAVTGPINSGGSTDDATPQLQGTLSAALGAGESLQILRGGAVVGTANVSATSWSFEDSLDDDGSYTYTARVVDAAGNIGPSSGPFTLVLATAIPTQTPTITGALDDVGPGIGTVSSGGFTNDTAPELQGTLSAPLGAGESLQILRGGSVVGTADVSGTSWSFADSLGGDGSYTYIARVVNDVGNAGPSSGSFVLNLDTVEPTQVPEITQAIDNFGISTGPLVSGAPSDDLTPRLEGSLPTTLSPGETLQLLRDGNVVGTGEASGNSWFFEDALPEEGSYTYTARVVDAAGNVGPLSAPFAIHVGTLSIDSLIDDDTLDGPIQTLPTGETANDATPTLNIGLSDVLASVIDEIRIFRDGNEYLGNATEGGPSGFQFVDSSSISPESPDTVEYSAVAYVGGEAMTSSAVFVYHYEPFNNPGG